MDGGGGGGHDGLARAAVRPAEERDPAAQRRASGPPGDLRPRDTDAGRAAGKLAARPHRRRGEERRAGGGGAEGVRRYAAEGRSRGTAGRRWRIARTRGPPPPVTHGV